MGASELYNGKRKQIGQTLRQMGWLDTGLYALDRLLNKVSKGGTRLYKYYLVAQPVAKASLLPPGRGAQIQVRPIGAQDAGAKQFPRPAAAIEARYAQGARCLAAFRDDRFIGYLWLSLDGYQEDEVRARFTPAPGAAWDFDVYVAPDCRLGFAFLRLWDEANRLLADNDIRWSCSRISAFNAGSRDVHARLGTVSLGSAVFLRAGRWQAMLATLPPYFHLSPHPAAFPEFRLDAGKSGEPVSPRGA